MIDGFRSPEDWRGYFAGFETIVLVANSDTADLDMLEKEFGADTLFVFFNKVYKVVKGTFPRRSLLVARSSPAGANIVYRNEVAAVTSRFQAEALEGILNLSCGPEEIFSPAEAFGGARAGHLDLTGHFAGFYPETHRPTSGFALALWLAEGGAKQVVLAGFTAQRSVQWKLFHDHDWTFEQIVLQLLQREGRLTMIPNGGVSGLQGIAERFPSIPAERISLAASDVLSRRLEGTNIAIDRLYSLTKLQSRLDGWFRNLKPRTRKQKLLDRKPGKTPS